MSNSVSLIPSCNPNLYQLVIRTYSRRSFKFGVGGGGGGGVGGGGRGGCSCGGGGDGGDGGSEPVWVKVC